MTEWRNLPETREFVKELKRTFPCEWKSASTWDFINRLKGQSDVIAYIDWVMRDDGEAD